MFKNTFSFKGRIRRIEYCISFIVYFIPAVIINDIIEQSYHPSDILLLLLFMIPLYWFILAQGAKRCHDRGNSGWYQIIPFYILWMFLGDSDVGINEYGPNPKGIGNNNTISNE